MAENRKPGLWGWAASFAVGEALSRFISFILPHALPLAGGLVLAALSTQAFVGVTIGQVAFWALAAFLVGGAAISSWRNQSAQRALVKSPADKLHGHEFALIRQERASTSYFAVFYVKNQAPFTLSIELTRGVCKVAGDHGRETKVKNMIGDVAPHTVCPISLHSYDLPIDGRAVEGEVHITLKYGHAGNRKFEYNYVGRFEFRADGAEVIRPAVIQFQQLDGA